MVEQPNFNEQGGEERKDGAHQEAVALVARHRDFFEHYARGEVKIVPAPEGVGAFAFDLNTNEILVNSMFYKNKGFSDEKTVFGICHEIEHFSEKRGMLEEEGGGGKFERYLGRIKTSRAFALMDNCNSDIRENRAVVSRTNVGMGDLETKIYKEDLFPEIDFTSQPRHIQFCQALLREARVPGELCNVSADVRRALDVVKNVDDLMEVMTHPDTPMSMRLKLQDKYIWPKVKELLEKDIEDKKKKEQEKKEAGKEKGEQGDQGDENGAKKEGGEEEEKEETDPNKIFADEYAEVEKKFPEAVLLEEVEKAFKKWKETQQGKNSADKVDEDYAEQIGVEKADLQEYRKTVEMLEKIVNPETGVSIKEELRNLFLRIIAKRAKSVQAPKYPVEESDELVDPAQLVADVKSGNLQPKVWEDTEIIEKKGDRFGEVEITFVFDRTGSMEGQKQVEQRKMAVFGMEALNEFAEYCSEEKVNMDVPLKVRSEIYTVQASEEDKKPLKKMSSDLGQGERVQIAKILTTVPGQKTTDNLPLEAIFSKLNEGDIKKIDEGVLKKIVIVFTDGDSSNPQAVQIALHKLRGRGVTVVGVGITKEGRSVLTTYAPEALVAEDVSKLVIVLGELLKEHLKDL